MGFTGASATWPTTRCWTAASLLMQRGNRTTTSEREAPMVSLSRPPRSPLCPATPLFSTIWASTWTVWWCRVGPAVWDRPWGRWREARPQTSPQAAVRDTPTSPLAPPHGWTRWTIPSFDFEAVGDRFGDTLKQTHKAFYVPFYRSARLAWSAVMGEGEKEGKEVWLNSEVTTGSSCAVWITAATNTALNVPSQLYIIHFFG